MKAISIAILVCILLPVNTYAINHNTEIYTSYLSKNPGDSVSKSSLKLRSALIPVMEDFDFNFYARIRSFVISYTQNEQVFEAKVRGNQIPNEQLVKLSKLKNGTRINFDKIEVDMPDGTIRQMYTYYFLKK